MGFFSPLFYLFIFSASDEPLMFHSQVRALCSPAVRVFEDSLIHYVRVTESGLFKTYIYNIYNSLSARYLKPSEILYFAPNSFTNSTFSNLF